MNQPASLRLEQLNIHIVQVKDENLLISLTFDDKQDFLTSSGSSLFCFLHDESERRT